MATSKIKAIPDNAGIPVQPTPATTLPRSAHFLPHYEAQVNENLRNFNQLEEQIGTNSYDRLPRQERVIVLNRKNKIIFALIVLLILGCLALATALAVHNGSSVCQTHPAPEGIQSRRTATVTEIDQANPSSSAITMTSTKTMHSVITPQATTTTDLDSTTLSTTILTTTTKSASIPASVASAASAYHAQVESIKSAILASANSRLSHVSYASTTSATSTATTTQASESAISISTSTSISSVPAPTATVNGMMGFCSVPGMFCAGGKRDMVAKVESVR